MKKLFLSLVAAIVAATATYAQSTLVATLSHGENITMYYGSFALRDAMNAAQSGDVINLSGGAFQAINITKAVTLRGTGIDDANPTYIINDFTINIPETDTGRLSMEGIRCTGSINFSGVLNNPYFVKSQFNKFYYNYGGPFKNAMFVDCKITGSYSMQANSSSSVQFVNCFVSEFVNNSADNCSASFINCVIWPWDSGNDPEKIGSSQLVNCIIYQTRSSNVLSYSLPSTTICSNCVAIGYSNIFRDTQASTGCTTATFAEVFKDFTGTYTDEQTFELTATAKTKYLGTDGSEVGLYGGILPYSPIPSYPQITKMNVANKTTADGKLSVEIEVSAAQ